MSFRNPADVALGKPNLGIGEAELKAVIAALVLAVRRARPKLLRLGVPLYENAISIQVYNELPKVQRDMRLNAFEFHLEGIIHDHRGLVAKIDGRIDFKVKFQRQVGNYDDYFGVECKRVDAMDNGLLRYYVGSGVGKFADEIYGSGHPIGMLVGYLMAPPINTTLDRLRRRMERSRHRFGPWTNWPGTYRDAMIVQADLQRVSGTPIRLLHAIIRMHH